MMDIYEMQLKLFSEGKIDYKGFEITPRESQYPCSLLATPKDKSVQHLNKIKRDSYRTDWALKELIKRIDQFIPDKNTSK